MPSSLMARAKAAQPSSSTPSSLPASTAPKKVSSLAAAAAASTGSQTNTNRGKYAPQNNKSTYVPSYKLNPLNAAASSIKVDANVNDVVRVTSVTDTADKQNDLQNKVQSAAATNHAPTSTPPPIVQPKSKTLLQQLLQNNQTANQQSSSNKIPAEYFMCSQSEAIDRQTHLELSPFECYPSSLSGMTTTISTVSNNNDKANFSSPQCSTKFNENNNNTAARRLRPKHHAQYVIKKYRRSAAGGGTLISDDNDRSLEQLSGTVEYLIEEVFVWQMPPPVASSSLTMSEKVMGGRVSSDPNEISIWEDDDDDNDNDQLKSQQLQHTPFSLSDTVAFIDDRLRAVQKDLVTLLGSTTTLDHAYSTNNNLSNTNTTSITQKRLYRKQLNTKQTVRKMQAKMVRYTILTSYLLSNVPSSKYEVKFGARALRTSIASYLDLSTTLDDDYTFSSDDEQSILQYRKEHQTKDEIMAYMALLHSSAVLRAEEKALPPPSSAGGEVTGSLMEESGSGWGALLSTFCKHVVAVGGGEKVQQQSCSVESYPRWKWALTLASLAQEGNFQGYFTLLNKGPSITATSSLSSLTKQEEVNNARFLLLARCCASHSLNLIRLGQLRRYNNSFGKGEKVSGQDMARLLQFDGGANNDDKGSAKLAIDFCQDAGLPIVEKEGSIGGSELYVAMKSAPISISKDGSIKRMCNPGRRNDFFVFGCCLEEEGATVSGSVDLLSRQLDACGLNHNVEDWGSHDVEADEAGSLRSRIEARVDEDGVVIPSSQLIRALMG